MIIFFDFNPRSHERSDVKEGEILLVIDISIHAPTRGATSSLKPLETYHCSFQSTLPREERHTSRKNSDTHTRISIHAPTRGATSKINKQGSQAYDFNPRSHERSDDLDLRPELLSIQFQSTLPREERLGRRAFLMELDEFQSTLPREERQYIHSLLILLTYFNPRSHERSDVLLHVLSYVFDISIHAPTRGATSPPS